MDVGHVSLQVNNTYISFWPQSAAKAKKDIKLGQTHEPVFPSSYRVDQRLERRQADSVITLNNLDETVMIDHWSKFTNNPDKYNMLSSNCSTVVAALLEAGSGIEPPNTPKIRIGDYVDNPYLRWVLKLRFMGNYIHMWTPNDVKLYALHVQQNNVI
jgi:hypothetical protein